MQYSFALPAQYDLGALHTLVQNLALPGFSGMGADSQLHALFSAPLTAAQQTSLTNAINGYTYQAPAAPPDVAGFLKAIPLDGKLTTSATEAIVTSGAGQLALQALTLGDFSHFQARYNDLKANPPAGATLADVQELGNLAASYHIPLTV